MKENISMRVEKIIEHLMFNVFPELKIKFTQKELSNLIMMAEGNITNAKKGDPRYINAFIEKVNNRFDNIFNEDWLLTGEGDMLKTLNASANQDINITSRDIGRNAQVGSHNVNMAGTNTAKGHIVNVNDLQGKKIIREDEIEIKQNSNAEELLLQKVASLETEIARLEGIIKSKDETIEAHNRTIASQKDTIVAKDEMIQYLMRNIEPK